MREARVLTPQNFSDIDDTTCTWDTVMGKSLYDYIQGWDKPHFPVPAIPLAVEWNREYIIVFYPNDDGESYYWDREHPNTCRCEVCRFWGA